MAIHEAKKIILDPEIKGPFFVVKHNIGVFEEHSVVNIVSKQKIIINEPKIELESRYYFSGNVYEESELHPVSDRVVRLYRRSTGELISSTTSELSGYYYLETPYSDEHYIIALDDETGTQYNLVALDWMVPVTI